MRPVHVSISHDPPLNTTALISKLNNAVDIALAIATTAFTAFIGYNLRRRRQQQQQLV